MQWIIQNSGIEDDAYTGYVRAQQLFYPCIAYYVLTNINLANVICCGSDITYLFGIYENPIEST